MSKTANLNDLTRAEKFDAFENLIDSHRAKSIDINGVTVSRSSLIQLFWNSADILPARCCNELDLPVGSNFAQAARSLKTQTVS